MNLHFQPITPTQVFTISAWRYAPPYEIYNLDYPPTHEDVAYWLDPKYQVQAILDSSSQIVAFCSFGIDGQVPGGDYSAKAMDIGMGVRPDLTGQGKGKHFALATCAFAQQTFPSQPLRVTVASKNARALRVWSGIGFRPVQQFLAANTGMSFDILNNNSCRFAIQM